MAGTTIWPRASKAAISAALSNRDGPSKRWLFMGEFLGRGETKHAAKKTRKDVEARKTRMAAPVGYPARARQCGRSRQHLNTTCCDCQAPKGSRVPRDRYHYCFR